jgi:hydroxymethylbilane synthase
MEDRTRTVQKAMIIGSRTSALALAQTHLMLASLQARFPEQPFEIRHITTHGDRVLDWALTEIGGKGVFVKEIEDALLGGTIDLAVHSCKDLPTVQPDGLVIGAIPPRADPRDVLVSRSGAPLAELPHGARVGTSSRRRGVQLHALRPDLQLADIRGNVDTRLRKLDEGQYDAIVLAAAGLARLSLLGRVTEFLDPQVFLPAPAQGALAIEIRADDVAVSGVVRTLDDAPARSAATAERAFLAGLGGGCDLPIGAYAWVEGQTLHLRGMSAVGASGQVVTREATGPLGDPAGLGQRLAADVLQRTAGTP